MDCPVIFPMDILRESGSPESEAFPQLLQSAREGNERALEQLFRTFYPRVERLVHRGLSSDLRRNRPWLRMRLSTGDVVQDVFRSVLCDLEGFGGSDERAFVAYLASVIRHRLIDLVRFHEAARRDGRLTTRASEEVHPPARGVGPATAALTSDEVEYCRQQIRGFPERERMLLQLRLEEGLDFPSIVEQLGYSSISAARRAFFAAQAQLLIRLRQNEHRGLS